MNTASYKYPLGSKVWVIADPQRATKKCEHCGEWTRWKPNYRAEEVVVAGISVFVSAHGNGASYELHYDDGTMYWSGKQEAEVFPTQADAESRIKELYAEWERLHSS